MGNSKWTQDHFRRRVKDQREAEGWNQKDMAKRLSDNGIPMHWTTIAKIEKGDRSVRIDEAAAIADLFGISVDILLGRKARPKADQVHVLTALTGTAIQSAGQIIDAAQAVRDRITDLSPFDDLPRHDALIRGCERTYDLLVAAHDSLTETGQIARSAMGKELKR